eukprot:TRINITY_DN30889_c0_g1_i8.p1 TRINITY_DN30889_c0_g1~~TRINITY_DN30889_c0_g1_i8.p1  ORF type:complete len:295 (-),score=63.94 TRINITY_DN30889_c0_g1_i8:692-1576(-)
MHGFGSKRAFDAIVLGGGVVGAATAYHLSKLGASVALVEKASHVALGATGASSGLVRAHYSVDQNAKVAQRSLQTFLNFQDVLRSSNADAGFLPCGLLSLAKDDANGRTLQDVVARLSARNVNSRMISLDEAKDIHPLLNLHDVAHVAWEPESGYADPYTTTRSYVDAAQEDGKQRLDVMLGTQVTGLVKSGERIQGVMVREAGLEERKLEAGVIVSCLNVWSQATIGQWLHVKLPVTIQKHCIATVANRHQHFVLGDRVFYTNQQGNILPTVKCLVKDAQPYYGRVPGRGEVR